MNYFLKQLFKYHKQLNMQNSDTAVLYFEELARQFYMIKMNITA